MRHAAVCTALLGLTLCTGRGSAAELLPDLRKSLERTELAFAATMRDRDIGRFATFIAADAVFLNGGNPLRGRKEVVAHWQRYFKPNTDAPFSWAPDTVEVAGNGRLGYTSGPVTLADGTANLRFYSTWQRQRDGSWRIVFDNGYKKCADQP